MDMHYCYLVPRLSSLPNIEQTQDAIHAYFLEKEIIKPILLSREESLFEEECYPLDKGFLDILAPTLNQQERNTLFHQVIGVTYGREPREFYWTGLPSTAICPQCQTTIGDNKLNGDHQPFDWVNNWLLGQDHMTCPQCSHVGDINAYDFQEPAAFSNFAIVFFNGISRHFSDEFMQDVINIMGVPIIGLDQKQ